MSATDAIVRRSNQLAGVLFGVGAQVLFAITVWQIFWFLRDGAPQQPGPFVVADLLLCLQFAVVHSFLLLPRTRAAITQIIAQPTLRLLLHRSHVPGTADDRQLLAILSDRPLASRRHRRDRDSRRLLRLMARPHLQPRPRRLRLPHRLDAAYLLAPQPAASPPRVHPPRHLPLAAPPRLPHHGRTLLVHSRA